MASAIGIRGSNVEINSNITEADFLKYSTILKTGHNVIADASHQGNEAFIEAALARAILNDKKGKHIIEISEKHGEKHFGVDQLIDLLLARGENGKLSTPNLSENLLGRIFNTPQRQQKMQAVLPEMIITLAEEFKADVQKLKEKHNTETAELRSKLKQTQSSASTTLTSASASKSRSGSLVITSQEEAKKCEMQLFF